MNWITALAGVFAGAAIATQAAFNATLSRAVGLWPTSFLVHVVGMAAALLPLWLFRSQSQWQGWNTAPWYVYLGGVLGVLIIYSISHVVTQLGVSAGVSIVIAAQLVVAMLIDQFGWFGIPVKPFDWVKLVGVLFLFLGARLVLR